MRSMVTIQAYANHFGVTRPTIYVWLRRYNEANKKRYNPKDIQSVFEFFEYLQKQFGFARRFFPRQD
jgi:Helix-turn-helix domain